MIERYLDYLSAIRRYSPRTIEIYRGVLEDFCIYLSQSGSVPSFHEATGGYGLSGSKASSRQNFALRAHPPQPGGWVPPVHEATGGHGSAGLNLAAEAATEVSGGSLPWSEAINVQTVRAYEVWLMDEKGEGAKTVNLHLSVLSGFCKFLMKEGVLESNPVRLVSRPKQEKRLPVFYREDAMRAYFEQTKGVLEFGKYEDQLQRMILGMLFATGLRRAELISLNRESVDLARRVLRVRGKGDKMREIPLPPVLCDEILLYLQAVDSLKYADRASEAPLLQTPRGERLYPVYVDRAVKAALAGIDGISGRKSPHVLRHTLATELLDGGADLNSIKELLGHSSLAATQVYTHNSIERLQSVYKSAHPRAKNDGNYGD